MTFYYSRSVTFIYIYTEIIETALVYIETKKYFRETPIFFVMILIEIKSSVIDKVTQIKDSR